MGLKLDDIALNDYNNQRSKKPCDSVCFAPQTSLYLGLRGNVFSCCFNKTYPLGKYPDQSLHEIWFGERLKTLKSAIENNDFSLGCHGCYDLIASKNYNNLPAKNFDELPINETSYPSKIDFELSNECNLECTMCRGEFSSAIRKNREKLPAINSPYNEAFLAQLEPFLPHIRHAHFLGGEPFLIPLYLSIWDRLSAINPEARISVQTNATILSTRIKTLIEKLRFDIAISIDSFEKETYEAIRKNARFEMVMENIAWFRSYCDRKETNLTLSFCPMTSNWSELASVINKANSLQAKIFFNTVYYPKELSLKAFSKNKKKLIIDQYESELTTLPHENEVERWNYSSFEGVLNQLVFWNKSNPEEHYEYNSFEDYLEALENHIKLNYEGSLEEKSNAAQQSLQKIAYILSKATFEETKAQAKAKLMEVTFDDMLNSLPNTPKEHLLQLFKSFIMPLAERA